MASVFGLLIGLIAGLLGVGGGELRLPVLICLLGLPVPAAAAANLTIGIFTVAVGLVKRILMGIYDPGTTGLIILMSMGSIFGAYGGASLTGKIKERYLRYAVGILLLGLGLKMIHGALVPEPTGGSIIGYPADMLAVSAVLGLLIGIVCGSLGVAGGELRIPALIYIFSQSIKMAGTVSLAVSVPTVATGALRHKKMGHLSREVLLVTISMAIPSVIGAYAGAALVLGAEEVFLKLLLGIIILLAIVRVVRSG